ncbi:MFS transporter [Variovorax sp. EL159]|uniref:MFS transporter n=1 Tax=Variovorax sp. EL159 TaxID=1566270 RepID=UPI00088C319B|nr:MFS transporter [Variovorax sp. EL159]SCX59498.1 MFS transporter, AAHS family, 4-hydroxybenzoate transporter [Variovorax sp. EL159]
MPSLPMEWAKTPSGATSRTARFSIFVCFLVALIDGYDTLMLSFVAPLISREWGMPPGAFGKVFAVSFAGAVVGAIAVGAAADRFGRRRLLLASLFSAGCFIVLSAWSNTPEQLMLWRFLSGIGLGGAIPTISALAAEHAQPAQRSATVSRMFLGFPIGAVAGGAITAALMQQVGWRGIFIGGGTLALAMLPLVLAMSEAGRDPSRGDAAPVHAKHPIAELVADGRGLGTVLISLAAFMILLVSYFLLSWTPSVLAMSGMSPQRSALAGVMLNVGGVAGAFAMSFVVARRSPFGPVAICLGLGALLVPFFGFHGVGSEVAAFCVVFAIGLLIIGGQMNIPALCVHYYPANVRATGVGLSMSVGRIGSIVGPLVGGFLVRAQLPWSQLFLLAAVPALLAAAALGWIAHRTRRA